MYEATRLIRMEKFDAARNSLKILIEDDDSNPSYRLAMGRAFHGLKKFDYAYDPISLRTLNLKINQPESLWKN